MLLLAGGKFPRDHAPDLEQMMAKILCIWAKIIKIIIILVGDEFSFQKNNFECFYSLFQVWTKTSVFFVWILSPCHWTTTRTRMKTTKWRQRWNPKFVQLITEMMSRAPKNKFVNMKYALRRLFSGRLVVSPHFRGTEKCVTDGRTFGHTLLYYRVVAHD